MSGVPSGTQSFFLHMHDLDLARNKTPDDQPHWALWNIPAMANGMPEGVPKGSELPDGSYQISATVPMYRGPGAAASGPFHHMCLSSTPWTPSWTCNHTETLSRPEQT